MLHEPGAPYDTPEDELDEERTLALPEPGSLNDGIADAFGEGRWVTPLILFVVGLAIYGLFAFDRVTRPSKHTHFVYLANTINTMIASTWSEEAAKKRQGKMPFELDRHPPHTNDWASWWELKLEDDPKTYRGIWLNGKGDGRFKTLEGKVYYVDSNQIVDKNRRYFVSFPPAPAIAMMPLTWIWGYQVNDVQFTLFFAALNIALMFMLLRLFSRGGRSGRSRRENLWLTALFAVGSAHLWCSVLGQVWFTALVMGVTCSLLYLYFAVDARRPFLAGVALAVGFATRTPLVFASVFFFAFVFFPGGRWRQKNWDEAFKKLAYFCIPCLLVGCGLLWMNHLRFGELTEFGHRYLAGGSLGRIKNYGLFNVHFLSKNLSAMLTLLPRFQPDWPYVIMSKHGMSIFLTSPALFYLFLAEDRESDVDRFWWRLLWVTVAVVGTPALFYQNTGYAQFGYRFIMDYLPLLIVLLAVGRRELTWLFKTCVVAGFIVNGFGAVTFKRMGFFYRKGFFL